MTSLITPTMAMGHHEDTLRVVMPPKCSHPHFPLRRVTPPLKHTVSRHITQRTPSSTTGQLAIHLRVITRGTMLATPSSSSSSHLLLPRPLAMAAVVDESDEHDCPVTIVTSRHTCNINYVTLTSAVSCVLINHVIPFFV